MADNLMIPANIESLVFTVRGLKVMIDRDLAFLYDVETKVLNQAVKRNIDRFPSNFMFKLNDNELQELVTICDRFKNLKHTTSKPYAFTEYGVAMLSSVLKSKKAIAINIEIIQAFIRLRRFAIEHKDLAQRISELEQYFIRYARENNTEIERIDAALNYLIDITKPAQIGFKTDKV